MTHPDINIDHLGGSREYGQLTQKSIASIAIGATACVVLAFFAGGAVLPDLMGPAQPYTTPSSLLKLAPEDLVELNEQIRFRSQTAVIKNKLKAVERELAANGQSVDGLAELVEQMDFLLLAIDPMRGNN